MTNQITSPDLRYLSVGFLGWYKVSLLRALPLDEEVQLPWVIGRSDNLLRCEASIKALRASVSPLVGLWLRLCLPLLLRLALLLGLLVLVLVLLDQLLAVEVSERLPGVVVRIIPAYEKSHQYK